MSHNKTRRGGSYSTMIQWCNINTHSKDLLIANYRNGFRFIIKLKHT